MSNIDEHDWTVWLQAIVELAPSIELGWNKLFKHNWFNPIGGLFGWNGWLLDAKVEISFGSNGKKEDEQLTKVLVVKVSVDNFVIDCWSELLISTKEKFVKSSSFPTFSKLVCEISIEFEFLIDKLEYWDESSSTWLTIDCEQFGLHVFPTNLSYKADDWLEEIGFNLTRQSEARVIFKIIISKISLFHNFRHITRHNCLKQIFFRKKNSL